MEGHVVKMTKGIKEAKGSKGGKGRGQSLKRDLPFGYGGRVLPLLSKL